MKFEVPILLVAYNRYETTEKVFDVISKVRPKKLFFAVDGHKDVNADKVKVEKVREIINKIDWDCQIKTLFPKNNLGLKVNVSSAINWFFGEVEAGIILEDDCLPNISFFYFCEELLEKYRNDCRVMHIGGNFFQKKRVGTGDYYFSQFPHIWGWATWRRAWQYYDIEMKSFPAFRDQSQIKNMFKHVLIQRFWMDILSLCYQGMINTWDYQWAYAVFTNNGLCIIPNVNLVSNIGFDFEALHTKNPNSHLASIVKQDIQLPLKHPEFILPNREADYYTNIKVFKAKYSHLSRIVLKKLGLFNTIKRIELNSAYWKRKLIGQHDDE
jgi:hypothetical protein